MAERAYWMQTNQHGQVDRIELHDSEYAGTEPELQFKGDKTGFTRQWDEITSESNEKLINIQANRIQIGKYDFRPRIENTTGSQILEDIRDSDNKRFYIVHKIDGTFEWAGWVTTRIFSYPEKANNFFAHIRATDFEILKGIDYPLDDTRQTFIDTFADLLSELPEDTPIKTATSWQEKRFDDDTGITKPYDFLDHALIDTSSLRDFGRAGAENDQPLNKFDALARVAEPALLIRQIGGHVMIDQLTELIDPADVHETIYNANGTVTTATQSVDRTQQGYTTAENGTPSLKNVSENDTYPAIKRVKAQYQHRTANVNIQQEEVSLSDGDPPEEFTITGFASDGNQTLFLGADVVAERNQDLDGPDGASRYSLKIDSYYFDNDSLSWEPDSGGEIINPCPLIGRPADDGSTRYGGLEGFIPAPPADADGDITLKLYPAIYFTAPDTFYDTTTYSDLEFRIQETEDAGTDHLNFQLSQDGKDYPQVLDLGEDFFGDGPVSYSPGTIRYGQADGEITEQWKRRGEMSYIPYHHLKLREVVDLGRTSIRKLEADIWGAYDASKVLDYNGSYFYFAGGGQDGTTGKWRPTLMEIKSQSGSEIFEKIRRYGDEGSSTSTRSTGGGGDSSGVTVSDGDSRWFQQDELFSEIATADQNEAIGNLGITATKDELNRLDGDLATVRINLGLTDGSADLDLNSLAINGDNLFSLFYTEQEINSFFDLYYSKADLTDGDEDLHLNSLTITNDSAESILFDRTENQDISNTYRVGVSSQDAYLIGSDTGQGALARFFPDGNVEFYGDTDVDGILSTIGAEIDGVIEILNNNFLQWNNAGADTGRFRTSYDGTSGRLRWDFFRSDNDSWESILEFPERSSPDSTEFLFNKPSKFNEKVVLDGDILYTTDSFSSGFLGSGARHDLANSEYNFETDVGRFRSALFATEFIVKQIRALSGSDHLSAGAGKVDNILDASTAGSEVIEVSDPEGSNYNPFAVNDIILCLQVRNDLEPNTVNVLTDDDPVITKRYVRAVDFINGDNVGFKTVSGAPNDAGSIEEGDVLVAIGNLTDSNRQDIIYRSVIERNSPFVSIKSGIDSWNAYKNNNNEVLHYGNLNGSYGYNGEIYGFAAGDPQGDHFTIESSNGLRFKDGSGNIGAQFSSSVLTVGDGFSYDAASNVLDVAAFTVTDKWLTDGQTYIGRDMWATLGAGNREEKVYIGDPFNEGSGSVQVRGTEDDTFAIMRSPRNSTDYMFRARIQGDTLFEVGLVDSRIASLEILPSRLQNTDGTFRLGNQGLQLSNTSGSSRAIRWYDSGFTTIENALQPTVNGLEVQKYNDSTTQLETKARFEDDYLSLIDGLQIIDGLLIALNLPTSDPQRQGQVYHDDVNNVLRLSTPGNPVIDVGATGTDTIVVEVTSETAQPYDLYEDSDPNTVVATFSDSVYEVTGLDPDTEYCYYITDDNGNDSNTECATTDSLEPEISCSGGTNAIQVNLDTPSTSPYDLYRNGSLYEADLNTAEFPYTDNFITGTYQYQVRDDNGVWSNITECTAT